MSQLVGNRKPATAFWCDSLPDVNHTILTLPEQTPLGPLDFALLVDAGVCEMGGCRKI